MAYDGDWHDLIDPSEPEYQYGDGVNVWDMISKGTTHESFMSTAASYNLKMRPLLETGSCTRHTPRTTPLELLMATR